VIYDVVGALLQRVTLTCNNLVLCDSHAKKGEKERVVEFGGSVNAHLELTHFRSSKFDPPSCKLWCPILWKLVSKGSLLKNFFHNSANLGSGPVYQGCFKSFPVQSDEHFSPLPRPLSRRGRSESLRKTHWDSGCQAVFVRLGFLPLYRGAIERIVTTETSGGTKNRTGRMLVPSPGLTNK
jgi:hypothetical protein